MPSGRREGGDTLVKALLVLVVIALIFQSGMFFYMLRASTMEISVNKSTGTITIGHHRTAVSAVRQQHEIVLNGTRRVEMLIPAVDSNGNGVMAKLIVEARPGSGRSLVDIDNILFWTDTQNSVRMARRVAERYLNRSLDNVDLIYTIEANATVIEGTSAGAALTIATIAVLENKTLRKDVTITGTINSDGTIGPVGAVLEKGEAAAKHGIKIFLVPLGQSVLVQYKPRRDCEKFGFVTYCETEYVPEKIDLQKKLGIKVVEVGNIAQALKYFIAG